ncbi:MAG: helix-turn-helix domain-containing protein, partial [Anaeroplasmataceae bacterium]|nr:helix-turn-helix domain-containing protein [Anaeroplasmataceae bacterium]
MNVGEKLKAARVRQGLTQDELAEKLHITRQTISNWENSKSYPDILQIVELSNLYGLSLDELLKDDEEMIKHLEKSTNVVKSKKKLYDLIFVGLYLVIWYSILLWFWSGGADESALGAMGFSIITEWIILPFSILLSSFLIGLQKGWKFRFLFSILFGISYPLSYYLT